MNWFIDLIREKGGSTTRLVMVFTFGLVFLVWGYSCYIEGHMIDLPENIMKLLVGISAAKVGQSWVERKKPDVTTPPQQPPPTS